MAFKINPLQHAMCCTATGDRQSGIGNLIEIESPIHCPTPCSLPASPAPLGALGMVRQVPDTISGRLQFELFKSNYWVWRKIAILKNSRFF